MLASVTIFAAFYAAIILFWNIAIGQHFGNAFAGLLAGRVLALYLHVLPGSKPNYQRSGITNTSFADDDDGYSNTTYLRSVSALWPMQSSGEG